MTTALRYALEVSSAPAVEPIDLAEAKTYCKVDVEDDDDLLDAWIVEAREQCEAVLDQALITQTVKVYLDEFPAWELYVPRSPLQSVTSIVYVATDGTSTTLSSSLYRVDAKSRPGRITPAYGEVWPTVRDQTNAITITYVAGYGAAASSVPAAIKQAMRLSIGTWYRHRDEIEQGQMALRLPGGVVDSLLMLAWDGRY